MLTARSNRGAAGIYTVSLKLGTFEATERDVRVTVGETTRLETEVNWPLFRVETVFVIAPAKLPERLLEASAATTTLSAEDLRTQTIHGQLPRMLESVPGVELTQSGLFDFNVNTRGFNTAVNRHVKTLIDGRDPSVPVLLGYQDWAANTMLVDDIDRVEFVRGPGAALYGAGAFNGVLSIVTGLPQDTPGGFGRFTFGMLATVRGEGRHAMPVGSRSHLKVTGGYQRSEDFTRSRVSSVEYAPGLLPPEVIPPHESTSTSPSARFVSIPRFAAGISWLARPASRR